MKAQDSNAARLIGIYEDYQAEFARRTKGREGDPTILASDIPDQPFELFNSNEEFITYGQISSLLNTCKRFRRNSWSLTYGMFKPWVSSIVGFQSLGTCQTSADYDCVLDYVLKYIRDPNISRSAERVDRKRRRPGR